MRKSFVAQHVLQELPFERLQSPRELGTRSQDSPDFHERPHDRNIDERGAPAPEHAGENGNPFFSERVWQITTAAVGT
jgi:hypothetical protein